MADKPRVLFVEDDRDMRMLLRLAAERAGVFSEVALAIDGVAALEMLAAATDSGLADALPDLIVTDLKMPRVNGVEFARSVKAQPQWRHIPVAMLTSSDLPEDRSAAEAAGCAAYFVKPANVTELVRIVKGMPDVCAAAGRAS